MAAHIDPLLGRRSNAVGRGAKLQRFSRCTLLSRRHRERAVPWSRLLPVHGLSDLNLSLAEAAH